VVTIGDSKLDIEVITGGCTIRDAIFDGPRLETRLEMESRVFNRRRIELKVIWER